MHSDRRSRLFLSIFKGIWIYSLLLWAYTVASTFVFPQYQFDQISVYIHIPQNLISVISFPFSFFSFMVWDYMRSEFKESQRNP
jgi:hypothetical protein